MSIDRELKKRAEDKCELCGSVDHLEIYTLPHNSPLSSLKIKASNSGFGILNGKTFTLAN